MAGPSPPPTSLQGRLDLAHAEINNRMSPGTPNPDSHSPTPAISVATWNATSISPYPDASSLERHTAVSTNLKKLTSTYHFTLIQETNCHSLDNQGVLGRMTDNCVAFYSNAHDHTAGVATLVSKRFLQTHTVTKVTLPPCLKGFVLCLLATPHDKTQRPCHV